MSEMPASDRRRFHKAAGFASLLGLSGGLHSISQAASKPVNDTEFRAAWVASVANIDWPSRKGLTAEQLKAETDHLIAVAQEVGLNALLLQVRPAADAIYPSPIEPWTEFLSGQQGVAPSAVAGSTFDPLQYWVDRCREARIQLHAWFNPYRAGHPTETSPRASTHLSRLQPELVKSYGRFTWMNPSDSGAAEHTLAVISDVITRYDIDGVHIDDYFYPYPETPAGSQSPLDFPDEANYRAYLEQAQSAWQATMQPPMSLADWRRSHVNRLVEQIYLLVKTKRPKLQFGISPFGIGKPSLRPPTVSGFSQFDSLYADVELWMEKGWMDYLAPQLYWPIASQQQAFSTLLNYWLEQNPARIPVYSGLYTSRIPLKSARRSMQPGTSGDIVSAGPIAPDPAKGEYPASEVTHQIAIARQRNLSIGMRAGHIHFSMRAIMENRDSIADRLKELYRHGQ